MGFFKAYDMRGTFGVDFDLPRIREIGRVLPRVVGGSRWLVGRDMRTTSAKIRDELVAGLRASGASVTDIGLTTTPMIYFFTAQDDFDGSVMITASHNPPEDNGLKVSRKTALPVGFADGLNRVEELTRETENRENSRENSRENPNRENFAKENFAKNDLETESRERYFAWMKERAPDFANVRFAVDCSNGMSAIFAKKLFPNAIILNDTLDGTFPAHAPNPLKPDAREQLARVVRENSLDCGIIFDGDADRAMFVDERGEFVQPDYLIPILAQATARAHMLDAREKDIAIIHDVRTSRGAIETLRENSFRPIMVPVGHAFAKPRLRETGALCGGELAGHYYFSEFFGCDSGLLAALRVLGEFAREKRQHQQSFSEWMKPILSRYVNSGELNFRTDDKDAAIARVLSAAAENFSDEISRTTMDGTRIDYARGWFNIRKSNTEPYLRLILETKTREELEEWTALLTRAVEGEK